MIEDIYEPLSKYRDEFKDKFARLTQEKFQSLTNESGIDIEANRQLVRQIKALQTAISRLSIKKTLLTLLAVLSFVVVLAAIGFVCVRGAANRQELMICCAGGLVGLVLGCLAIHWRRGIAERLATAQQKLAADMASAWRQMEPLNALFTWDITVKLIEATVPRLAFDPYSTAERLLALRTHYGWNDFAENRKSMIFAQTGVINGNPFAFVRYLQMRWGEETYHGTKTISWMETVRDEKGRPRRVRRQEVLHASLTKPKPFHDEHKELIYGNEAAPNLFFSREPSGLTGQNGLWGSLRKYWRLRRLKAFSANLDDASQYTLMANHEFETWFHAKNRDNEVEFRLLFTPIAQTQLMALMKDEKVGFGDDFKFTKIHMMNFLSSEHLDKATIETDPARFRSWDYDASAAEFKLFNERYFKDVYFAFAPLLAIPLYQQTRTHEEIWKGIIDESPASSWEFEATANFHGEGKFRHPDSVTRNILKTEVVEESEESRLVSVTAHGFKGIKHIEHVSVFGGDGAFHDVPVEWIEYVPVARMREMAVSEAKKPSADFGSAFEAAPIKAYRRHLFSYLGKDLS